MEANYLQMFLQYYYTCNYPEHWIVRVYTIATSNSIHFYFIVMHSSYNHTMQDKKDIYKYIYISFKPYKQPEMCTLCIRMWILPYSVLSINEFLGNTFKTSHSLIGSCYDIFRQQNFNVKYIRCFYKIELFSSLSCQSD